MPELSGRFDERGFHHYPVRVFYEDTDAGGIVYHANYLRYCERGRSAMLVLAGIRHTELLEREGVAFAVRSAKIDFRAPARLEDTLEVETGIDDIRGASFAVAQTVRRSGLVLAHADLSIATINRAGRAVRMPPVVREALIELYQRQTRDR